VQHHVVVADFDADAEFVRARVGVQRALQLTRHVRVLAHHLSSPVSSLRLRLPGYPARTR
jgi:hypothetical protein